MSASAMVCAGPMPPLSADINDINRQDRAKSDNPDKRHECAKLPSC